MFNRNFLFVCSALACLLGATPLCAQVVNPGTPTIGNPTNGHCAQYVVSGGNLQGIQDSGGGCASGVTGANPTATAGPNAVNGSATTFMRSDAAPPVQLGSGTQPGLIQCGTGTTCTGGTLSVSATGSANPSATAGPNVVNGSATTFMRSDAAPAVQKGSASQFGLMECDGTSLICSAASIGINLANSNAFTVQQNATIWNAPNGSLFARIEGNTGGGEPAFVMSNGTQTWYVLMNSTNFEIYNPTFGAAMDILYNTGVTYLEGLGSAGGTYCVQVSPSGQLSNTGAACGSGGGGGAVNSVSNTDNQLAVSPNTGSVVVNSALVQFYKCTGTDQSAINALMTSGISTLRLVGQCAGGPLNTMPQNFTLEGGNPLSDCYITNSATGNIITMNTGGGDVVQDLCMGTSVTRTAGDYIYMTGSNPAVHNVLMYGIYNGIEMHAVGSPVSNCPSPYFGPCGGGHISNVKFYGNASNGGNTCIVADGTSGSANNPENDGYIENVWCTGLSPSSPILNGMVFTDVGEIHLVHADFENMSNSNILINPSGPASSGNGVNWLVIDDALLDGGAIYGMYETVTSGAYVQNVDIHDGWVANNNAGLVVSTDSGNGSFIINTNIHNEHIIDQTVDGIRLVANSNIQNIFISDNLVQMPQTSSGAALSVGGNVFGFKLSNNQFNGGPYGVFFSTSGALAETSAVGNIATCSAAGCTTVAGSPTLSVNPTGGNSPNF